LKRVKFIAVLLLLIALPRSLGAQAEKPQIPDDPLRTLKNGNAHFFDDEHFKEERKRAYQGDQRPYAVILSCSDSRVPPELVFGEWELLGKLFVVRAAGNVVDPVALGSIEYGVEHLHAKLIFVLGHERCGAVRAAIEQAAKKPALLPPNISWFVDPIKLAVERTKGKPEIETVKENVRVQIQNLRTQSSIIRELEEKEGLRIAGGFYNFSAPKSGKVDFF
jgi:carbonic anhydrase